MIKKEVWAKIILDFFEKDMIDVFDRDLEINLESKLKRANVIVGPRRVGKTFYVYSLIKKILAKKIDKSRILYLNFEDPKLVNAELEDLSKMLETYYEIYPQNKDEKIWLFFDEVQNIDNWEIFIRSILDNENAFICITGSSSKLLSKEIATSLRGRAIRHLMLPFSFDEFLRSKELINKRYLSSKQSSLVNHEWMKYFQQGGYPEIMFFPEERKKIITEIIETTIFQDIIERHKIRNTKIIRLMFNFLIEAKEFSVHKFFNYLKSLNIKSGKNNLYDYLEFFSDAYIFFPLKKYSNTSKTMEQTLPKIYCVDNALIDIIQGENNDKKLENFVFLELIRRGYELNKELFYYVSKAGEVDFFINKKTEKQLIQVCFDMTNDKTQQREIKSLLAAMEELKINKSIIITNSENKKIKYNNNEIQLIPVINWLKNI